VVNQLLTELDGVESLGGKISSKFDQCGEEKTAGGGYKDNKNSFPD
jgi:hypothetical protein